MSHILEKINEDNIIITECKKGYNLLYIDKNNFNKKINIITPKIYVPFGIENFGNKLILNLEFSKYKTNNCVYNFYAIIKSLEKYVNTSLNISSNKETYVSCIKDRPEPYEPLLRTNIKKYGKKIITNIVSKCNTKTLEDINKNSYIHVELELNNIWISNGKYGINWDIITIFID
jgi:hypothetical protein